MHGHWERGTAAPAVVFSTGGLLIGADAIGRRTCGRIRTSERGECSFTSSTDSVARDRSLNTVDSTQNTIDSTQSTAVRTQSTALKTQSTAGRTQSTAGRTQSSTHLLLVAAACCWWLLLVAGGWLLLVAAACCWWMQMAVAALLAAPCSPTASPGGKARLARQNALCLGRPLRAQLGGCNQPKRTQLVQHPPSPSPPFVVVAPWAAPSNSSSVPLCLLVAVR